MLLEKLKNYGYRGPIHNILADYLSQRFHHVSVRTRNSPSREIRYGGPQGSNLGPFLFIVYINDMPDVCQNSEVAIFANDTSNVKAGKPNDCSMQMNWKYLRIGSITTNCR